MTDTASAPKEQPWHAAFPAAKSTPDAVNKEELLEWLKAGKVGGKDFVLVDLRRTDYEGGTVRGSINLPAQSLYPTIPYLYNLFSAAGAKKIIWYCGSSQGRGTRAAAWFQDHIDAVGGAPMQSYTLKGGIKGWVGAGEEYVKFVDGYEKEAWTAKI